MFYCNHILDVTFGLWLSWTLQQYTIYHVSSHMVFIKSNFMTISSLVVVRPKLTIKLYLYESQKAKSKQNTNRDLIRFRNVESINDIMSLNGLYDMNTEPSKDTNLNFIYVLRFSQLSQKC